MKKALFDWNCILPLMLINVLLAVLKKNTSEHTLLVTLKKIIIANIWPLFCICMDPALKRSPHIFSRLEVRALGSSFQKLYGSFLSNCRFQDQTILWKYKLLCCVITLLCQVLKEDTLWTQDEGTLIRMCRNKWGTTMYSCVCMLHIKQ